MAGSYPNIPGERIAYELDSGILLQRYSNNTTWASINDLQKTNFNKEKNMRALGDNNSYLLDVASLFQVIFPVPYNIYGVYASVVDYFDFAGQVFISTDTTNGSDGTWNLLTTGLFPQNATRTYSTETDYRSKIANITGATGIKGIRFSSLYTGLNSQYIYLTNFHIYGSKSSASNSIEFWNSDNTAKLLPQDWDFGDTVEGSTEIKQFKIKNYLNNNIEKMHLSIEIPTDPTISIMEEYKLSTDQVNWNNVISIPSTPGQIISNGGGVSETVYLKRYDSELHASGLFTGRVRTYIDKYDTGYWTVNGQTTKITDNLILTDQLQIVPGTSGNVGTAWYSETLSLPLSLNFSYTLSNSNAATGADGFTIAFKNKDTSLNSVGTNGGGLGIYNIGNRAVGIAIDCYQGTGERTVPYISSFDTHNNTLVGQSNTTGLTTTEINGTHTISITITDTLATVSLDGIQKWTSTDLPKMLPSEFIMGFTAAGGSAYSKWSVTPTSLTYGPYVPVTPPSQVTSGAVLNYDFANSSCYSGSGNTITDLSGNNNTGTIYGGVSYSSSYGGILQFDGNTGYISLPSTSFSNFTSGISIAFSANLPFSNPSALRLLDFGGGSTTNNIIVYRVANSSTLGFGFYDNGTYTNFIEDSKNYVPDNQMSHYVLVHNGTNFLAYRNGFLVATKASTILPLNQTRSKCYIGQSFDNAKNFDGQISTLKIFNRALSAAEALQDFQATRSRYKI